MKQPSLLDLPDPVEVIASGAPPQMRPRLNRQALAILDRLREGPATNRELCAIGLKYNARISELRQAGYDVVCRDHDHLTGIATYILKESPNDHEDQTR